MNDGPFALGELELQPQWLEDQEDVGEQDRGIDAQPFGRGDRHLGRQLGPFAQFQERDLRADGPVFGHVTAGLPHQPDRRDLRPARAGRL